MALYKLKSDQVEATQHRGPNLVVMTPQGERTAKSGDYLVHTWSTDNVTILPKKDFDATVKKVTVADESVGSQPGDYLVDGKLVGAQEFSNRYQLVAADATLPSGSVKAGDYLVHGPRLGKDITVWGRDDFEAAYELITPPPAPVASTPPVPLKKPTPWTAPVTPPVEPPKP